MNTKNLLMSIFLIASLFFQLEGCSSNVGVDDQSGPIPNGETSFDTDVDSEVNSDTDSRTNSDVDFDVGSDADSDADKDMGFDESDECVEVTRSAYIEKILADIVIVVDNSKSMGDEAGWVQANMNTFSQQISDSDIDAHVVLLSADSGSSNGICVDKPLGSGTCPDDSNPATNYLHSPRSIDSHDALKRIYETYDDPDCHWKEMLRPEAVLHFIVVTDDDSDLTAIQFIQQLKTLNPPIDEFIFHGIVSSEDDIIGGPCEDLAAKEGTVYKELASSTGGVLGDLCKQKFQPVFKEVAAIVGTASMACQWKIPDPPDGENLDPDRVNMRFTDDDGKTHTIGRIASKSDCDNVQHGWYYDDPAKPTNIYVCDQTCEWLQGQADAELQIVFGCETIEEPPVYTFLRNKRLICRNNRINPLQERKEV